jgi:uncharacterized coiled-coil DUF342 family protein
MKILQFIKNMFSDVSQDSSFKNIMNEINKIIQERDYWRDRANHWETMATHHREEREELKNKLEKYRWKPIEDFDRRMFSLMSTGIPDSTEVVKYKGEIPDWAAVWTEVPPLPGRHGT